MRFMGDCEQTETFSRLFLIPGVHHGRGGPGLTEFDALTALEKWVERGPPPKLIACHRDNGVIERCRPVFPYPDVGSLFRQTRSEGGREFRALRLLPALSSFCGSRSMRLHSGRIV
jgi:Tannase and feruloyl esterase